MSDIALLKIEGGMAKALNIRGVYIKTIGESGAISAMLQGGGITVSYANGKTKLYNINGTYIKTL